ncbi:MAG: class I SAM-dependent rRNA methyltransferase [Acidobacteria bacterium]|nr:class I SAM-dependent rRNA methyltransferase [Acidobacteriota bacterium]
MGSTDRSSPATDRAPANIGLAADDDLGYNRAMRTLHMRKNYHERLLRGHLWGWRNDFPPDELRACTPGEAVRVESRDGEFVGVGFANPASFIAFRLFHRRDEEPGEDHLRRRLVQALAWRRQVRAGDAVCRLVFGESDGLPGLVVDRYGPVLVMSQSVRGLEPWTEFLADELAQALAPETIILKNTNLLRRLEGLPLATRVLRGRWDGPVTVDYDGVSVPVDCRDGRKTGLFLDHRENRRLLGRMLRGGERVLDLFSHCGLWSLTLLRAGAAGAVAVDNDPAAVAAGETAAAVNGWTDRLTFVTADVRDFLTTGTLADNDVVVLDPPAFAKKKRYLKNALATYREYNTLALRRVRAGGLLATSSCSSFVRPDMLQKLVQDAALDLGRTLQWVAQGAQALDHPVLPAMPETHYLKCMVYRVLD